MTVVWAETLLNIIGGYLALGGAFALVFLTTGLGRVDPVAAAGPLRFKLLIAPGIVAIWPVMLVMWLKGSARSGT